MQGKTNLDDKMFEEELRKDMALEQAAKTFIADVHKSFDHLSDAKIVRT